MTSLLHVNHGAVLTHRLMRLTENRVQWLLKNLFLVEEGDIVCYDKLHALKWV